MGNGKRYYLTTAIDYVNSKPHLGHAYEKVAADVLARYWRLQGREVFLLVGVDEHSQNVVRKAQEIGLTTQSYTDQMVDIYRDFFQGLQVDYQRLIRTSDEDHKKLVQQVVLQLAQKGYLYPGRYTGWYCPSCEAFYRERDLVDGHCPVHDYLELDWVEEYNLYFRLSAFAEPIYQLLQTNWLEPESRRNELLRRLEGGLEDISISRAVGEWGIEIPTEVFNYLDYTTVDGKNQELVAVLQDQRIYVWFDALLNYVTGSGSDLDGSNHRWPPKLELIGKDIIWFHGVIQPALLLALDLPLPKKVFAHGFMTLEGEKISSSRGNVLYPREIIDEFGLDPLRYYFFRRVSFGLDGDFSRQDFIEVYNTSLANVLGNLVHRSLKMTEKYFGGEIPEPGNPGSLEQALLTDRQRTLEEVAASFENLELSQALLKVEEFIRRINRYIDETLPWTIQDEKRLATVIYYLLDSIYCGALLLSPWIPETGEKIIRCLGQQKRLYWPGKEVGLEPKIRLQSGGPLFPRLEK